jgi:small subunit ribosomal protein S13e
LGHTPPHISDCSSASNAIRITYRFHKTANMGRLHSNGKGISSSAIPYSRTAPAWLKTTPDAVEDQICKLAKKGATPSQIGVVLRDSHGIAQVKIVTGMFTYFAGWAMRGGQC